MAEMLVAYRLITPIMLTYLFLNCLNGQTTEKYLSMVRETVMYTLAVRLVCNIEHGYPLTSGHDLVWVGWGCGNWR